MIYPEVLFTFRIILVRGTTLELASSISRERRSAISASFFFSSSVRSSFVVLGGGGALSSPSPRRTLAGSSCLGCDMIVVG